MSKEAQVYTMKYFDRYNACLSFQLTDVRTSTEAACFRYSPIRLIPQQLEAKSSSYRSRDHVLDLTGLTSPLRPAN
jgi:hypothetical protein